jgi:hypothetical protein
MVCSSIGDDNLSHLVKLVSTRVLHHCVSQLSITVTVPEKNNLKGENIYFGSWVH